MFTGTLHFSGGYMLNKQGFNLWAEDYDRSVQLSEEKNEYPFAGYKAILNAIYNEIMHHPQTEILEVGIGTGVLATKLYDNNHVVTGIDFSPKMLEISQNKMPNAKLLEWDIQQGVPHVLKENKFDFIVSTYTLHHLTDEQKVSFLNDLTPSLKRNGKILIGDISFESSQHLQQCKQKNEAHWDPDEFYFVYDEIMPALLATFNIQYEQISECGGIYMLEMK